MFKFKTIALVALSSFLAACGPSLDKNDPANSVDCKTLSQHERSPGNNCNITTDRDK